MSTLIFLIPLALFLGIIALLAFLWSLKSGQFDDLEGAALRILIDNENELKQEIKQEPVDSTNKKDDKTTGQ